MKLALHDELIQVAAVAAAAVQFLGGDSTMNGAIADVVTERISQDRKWGEQRDHTPIEWAMILAEEVGEAYDEALDDLTVKDILADSELKQAYLILGSMAVAGEEAKAWLDNHEWPERQQQVVDAENVKMSSEERPPAAILADAEAVPRGV